MIAQLLYCGKKASLRYIVEQKHHWDVTVHYIVYLTSRCYIVWARTVINGIQCTIMHQSLSTRDLHASRQTSALLVWLSVCMSALWLLVRLPVCLLSYQSTCLSACQYDCLSVCLLISIILSVSLCVRHSSHPSVSAGRKILSVIKRCSYSVYHRRHCCRCCRLLRCRHHFQRCRRRYGYRRCCHDSCRPRYRCCGLFVAVVDALIVEATSNTSGVARNFSWPVQKRDSFRQWEEHGKRHVLYTIYTHNIYNVLYTINLQVASSTPSLLPPPPPI